MMHCQVPLHVGVSRVTLEGCGAGTTGEAESEDLRERAYASRRAADMSTCKMD